MDQRITSWIDAIIPQDSVDLPFTIPCLTDPRCSSLEVTRKPPENMAGMISWLKSFPLPIVQHVVHFLCPQSKGWRFILGNDCDGDESIFQYFTWSTMDLDSPMNARNSAIIAFQPPWILSEQDMREFSECRSFPPFRKLGNAFPISLQSKERLWAKIWDLCVKRRTHWFVLTSYDNWVFGVFSTGWTAAFVTGVYTFDMYNPTITEALTFWTVAAMRIPGCSSAPKVPEPLAHYMLPVAISQIKASIPTPASSESNWEGKNDDFGSSAGVRSTLSEAMFEDTGLMNRLSWSPAEIRNWMDDASGPASQDLATGLVPNGPLVDTLEPTNMRLGDWLA